jgi:hypothetical protein
MADDLSGLMSALGVSNPLTTVFARATPGASTPAAIQPAMDAMAGGATEAKTATPGMAPVTNSSLSAPAAPTTPATPATPSSPQSSAAWASMSPLERQQWNTRRGLYDSLLQRAMMTQFDNGTNATGGANPTGTGYVNALMAAMQQPGGSRSWLDQQKQSAIPIMQQMQEWKDWGFDKYDWTPGDNFGMKLPSQPATPAPPPVPTQQNSPKLRQPQGFRTPQALKRASIIGRRAPGGI